MLIAACNDALIHSSLYFHLSLSNISKASFQLSLIVISGQLNTSHKNYRGIDDNEASKPKVYLGMAARCCAAGEVPGHTV